MIVVGDIVEIISDKTYGGEFFKTTGEVLTVDSYGCSVAVKGHPKGLYFFHSEIRLAKESKVLEILRTWRDSRLETE